MNHKEKLSDYEWLLLLQQKDESALSHIYDMYAPGIYGLLLRQVGNENLASKILKNTFVNIWNECEKADCIKQRLFTWILALTHKTALSDFKINLQKSTLPVNSSII